jgi:hypothetical protein
MARPLHQPSAVEVAAYPFGKTLPDGKEESEERSRGLLSAPLRLLRQGHRFYHSPARFGQLLLAFCTNIGPQFDIFKLLASPALKGLVRLDPIFPFKYLTRGYLVPDLSASARAAAFAHHYRCLHTNLPASMLRKVLYEDAVLVDKEAEGHRLSVHLSLARTEVREGELTLILRVDGIAVYCLQFTIVPGSVVRSDSTDVIMISRVQGMKGCYEQVRLATKAFQDVAPPALLLSVLHGLAQLCGIDEMAGVSAASQYCYEEGSAESFRGAYDAFWLELGAERKSPTFFVGPLPPKEKSLENIKNGHKARTRKKREFKKQIAEDVFHLLLGTKPEQLHALVPKEEHAETTL